jgi:hypothetical protein
LFYVYEDPVEFVRRRAKHVNDGQYRLILLFLGTQFNEEFVREVEGLTQDIDSLTGPHAMAILFTPPPSPPADFMSGFGSFRALGKDWIFWDEFLKAMTDGAYSLAESLGIPYKDLPVVVFLDPDEDDPEFAVWKFKNVTFRELYDDLRSVLNHWYQDNSELIAKIALLEKIVKYQWNKVPSNQPEMPVFKAYVKDTVVPKLLEAAEIAGVSGEVKQRIEGLSSEPRNTAVMGPALAKSLNPLVVGNEEWTADTFGPKFFAFAHDEADVKRRELLRSLKFPLQSIDGTKRKLAFRRFIDRVDLGSIEAEAGGVKFKYNPLSMLRHAFGMKDPV